MKARFSNWLSQRLPLVTVKKWIFEEEIPAGSRYAYTLGSAALFLLFILIITGIWQMFIYDPSVDHAYDSLAYLRINVPFGWLINGLHYWGGTAFSVVVGLHMIRVFIWGAYKKPREVIWLSGIVLLLLTALFMFTGPILPWDKKGYWACKVGFDMMGTIPWIGSFIQSIFWATEEIGQLTIARMFTWHVEILPILTGLFVGGHLIAFRMHGSVGPWKQKKQRPNQGFWPEQIFKDAVVSYLIFLLLIALAVFVPPAFNGAADPLDTLYVPKPEWNFSFFYRLLEYFHGVWEPVGIVSIPLIIILFFASLPFIDRSKERNPLKRLFVIIVGSIFFIFILVFTLIGVYTSPRPAYHKAHKKSSSVDIEKLHRAKNASKGLESLNLPKNASKELESLNLTKNAPKEPSKSSSSKQSLHLTNIEKGEALFKKEGCISCHSISGEGKHKLGPDLRSSLSGRTDLTTEWLHTQIVSPKQHNPHSMMPAFKHLTPSQLDDLIVFLQNLSKMPHKQPPSPKKFGHAITIVGNKEHGMQLYENFCQQCHGPKGQPNAKGFEPVRGVPPLNPISKSLYSQNVQAFLKNIDPYIQYGAPNLEKGPNMPDFGASHSLTQQEIADIEAYVLQLNGVNRAKINTPGMAPHLFFYIFLAISGGVACLGILFWLIKRAFPSSTRSR